MRRIVMKATSLICLLVIGVIACTNTIGQSLTLKPVHQCTAIETVSSNQEYNELVCAGIDAMHQGKYQDAINLLERAGNISILEYPNFKVYPLLALAYSKVGDQKKAKENLEKARLSLSVLVGIYHCTETVDGFYISHGINVKVDSQFNDNVARKICGESYDYVYDVDSLETVVANAKLIESYFSIRNQIDGKHINQQGK
jgi:tetratricopeptide (TPR) repeat protein